MENYEILEELFKTYEQPMYRICFSILGNVHQAEDAVGDAFERLIKYLPECKGVTDERTKRLIVRITQSAAIDIYRKNKKENIVSMEDYLLVAGQRNVIDDYIDAESNQQLIKKILKDLPESYAEIVRLRFFYGLQIEEIAQQLEISEDTVYQRISRARKMVKDMKSEMTGDDVHEKRI